MGILEKNKEETVFKSHTACDYHQRDIQQYKAQYVYQEHIGIGIKVHILNPDLIQNPTKIFFAVS